MERHLRKRNGRLVLEESKESLFTESRLLSLFNGRIVELRAFVVENAWGEHRARPRVSVRFMTFSIHFSFSMILTCFSLSAGRVK